MSWLGRILGLEGRSRVNVANPRDPVLAEWFGGSDVAGVSVTENSAMGVAAVYACVTVLAETIASLPLHVYRRTADGEERDRGHPLYPLLHDAPNDWQTAFEWREMLVASVALRGDSYSRLEVGPNGRVLAINPIDAMQVSPEMTDRGIRFRYGSSRGSELLFPDDVLRVPHKLKHDGSAMSPIRVHRDTIGAALAARRYQAALLGNAAAPKGALKVPVSISDQAAAALRDSWERRHKGPENAGKLAILDGGMEWSSIGMSNEDAQFVEMLQLSVQDVARIFRVQPHKIGDLSRATFSNIEHQGIEFVTDTILPWVRRIEARMTRTLISEAQRATHYIEFDLKGLLRGDARTRSEFYRNLFYIGAINPNEIRRLEGMNPIDGGDTYYVQGATVPVDMLDATMNQMGQADEGT